MNEKEIKTTVKSDEIRDAANIAETIKNTAAGRTIPVVISALALVVISIEYEFPELDVIGTLQSAVESIKKRNAKMKKRES